MYEKPNRAQINKYKNENYYRDIWVCILRVVKLESNIILQTEPHQYILWADKSWFDDISFDAPSTGDHDTAPVAEPSPLSAYSHGQDHLMGSPQDTKGCL